MENEIKSSDSEQISDTTPPPPSKKTKVPKVIIISLIIIILIGLGSIIFSQQSGNPDKNKTLSKSVLNNPAIMKLAEKLPLPKITMVPITVEPTSTPAQDSSVSQMQTTPTTAPTLPQDWKTYKYNDLNFTLSYPSNLTLHENAHGLGISDISFVSPNNPDSVNYPDYQILIYPKTVGKLIGQDFDQLYALPVSSTQRMTMAGHDNTPQQFTKINNNNLDNLRAFKFQTNPDPPDPNQDPEIGEYIEIEDSTIIISTSKNNEAILDHLLSTLKHSS